MRRRIYKLKKFVVQIGFQFDFLATICTFVPKKSTSNKILDNSMSMSLKNLKTICINKVHSTVAYKLKKLHNNHLSTSMEEQRVHTERRKGLSKVY